MADPTPIIAISGMLTVDDKGALTPSKSVLKMKELVERSGARAVIIDQSQADPKQVNLFDGVVFMGNDYDIDPKLYGQERRPETKVETEAHGRSAADTKLAVQRSDYEYQAMAQALNDHVPIFGVCAGMQRLNVLCGGSLNQHVANHWQTEDPSTPVLNIHIEPGSQLSDIAGERRNLYTPAATTGKSFRDDQVNSFHHQAIDQLGKGFRISALSEDGTIEAIESVNPQQPVMGVQWHPEFMPDNPLSGKLVEALVTQAKGRAIAKQAILDRVEALEVTPPTTLPFTQRILQSSTSRSR